LRRIILFNLLIVGLPNKRNVAECHNRMAAKRILVRVAKRIGIDFPTTLPITIWLGTGESKHGHLSPCVRKKYSEPRLRVLTTRWAIRTHLLNTMTSPALIPSGGTVSISSSSPILRDGYMSSPPATVKLHFAVFPFMEQAIIGKIVQVENINIG